MEKPNYRIGKIGIILEGSILASVKIRNTQKSIEEKTFARLFNCSDYDPSCAEHECGDYEFFGCGCLCDPHSESGDNPDKEEIEKYICNYDQTKNR